MKDLTERSLEVLAECANFQKEIQIRNAEIELLKSEIKLIQDELYQSFDEWYNCTDLKQKDKLEWKRNKVSSPINSKIYRIQALKYQISTIEKNIIQYISEEKK